MRVVKALNVKSMEARNQFVRVSVMLEDSAIDKLILTIEQQIDIVVQLIESGVEEKFKYLLVGKISGMIEALRMLK